MTDFDREALEIANEVDLEGYVLKSLRDTVFARRLRAKWQARMEPPAAPGVVVPSIELMVREVIQDTLDFYKEAGARAHAVLMQKTTQEQRTEWARKAGKARAAQRAAQKAAA